MSTPWVHPAAPPVRRPDNPLAGIGLASLLVALAELAWFGYRLAGALLAGLLDYAQRALLPGAVPPAIASAANGIMQTARTLLGWEAASLVPCAFMAIALFILAIGLLGRRVGWLTGLRIWCGVAPLAVIAAITLQIAFIVPELQRVEAWVDTHLAARGRAMIVVPTMIPMFIHAALAAIWPIALWAWAGSVRRKIGPHDLGIALAAAR